MSIEMQSVQGQGFQSPVVDEYEFSAMENTVIESLAARMKYVGYATLVFIAAQALIGVAVARENPAVLVRVMISAMFTGAFAAMMLSASKSFSQITKTEGSDVAHLMTALGKLATLYLGQAALLTLAALLTGFVAMLSLSAM